MQTRNIRLLLKGSQLRKELRESIAELNQELFTASIFNIVIRELNMMKLAGIPWEKYIKTTVDHINLLCLTMVPDVIIYRLIQEDVGTTFEDDCAFDEAMAERVMIVMTHKKHDRTTRIQPVINKSLFFK